MVSSSGRPSLSSTAVDDNERVDELAPAPLLADRYVVVERVGEGGMGQVWRGFDVKLERAVALKFLHRGSSGAEAKIVREARAMARLSHPNVLPVFDVVTSDGVTFIVMELVTGRTLKEWMAESARELPEVLAVFAAAARGLQAAHEAGFVHRDFKPANVLIGDDGRVRVMDFGLAHESVSARELPDEVAGVQLAVAGNDSPTLGVVLGTPAYMAPEQRAGEHLDACSDQYSFCISLYEAVFGHRPRLVDDPTADLDTERRAAPMWLRELLRRGLARAAAQRHRSLADIAALLEAQARPRRGRWMALAAVATIGVAVAGGTVVQRLQSKADQARCAELGELVGQTWGAGQRDAVEHSLRATGVPYADDLFERVRPWLDRYADEWAAARAQLCMAASVDGGSAVPVELAVDCLEERRVELAALVDRLANADDVIAERAVPAAANLPALDACLDPTMLELRPRLPTDPQVRDAILALRGELAGVVALVEAGRHEFAAQRADELMARAEATGWPPIVAQARAAQAHVDQQAGRLELAKTRLVEAFRIARDARADDVASEAAVDLVFLVGRVRSEFDEGLLWSELATTLLERAAVEHDPRWAGLHTNIGLVLLARGSIEEALEHMQLAVALNENAVGPTHPWLATPLNNLGLALAMAGDHRGAIEQYQRALTILEANLGSEHPEAAMTLHNIGDALLDSGEVGEGRAYNERALAIWERTLAPDHSNIAMALNSIGHAQLRDGDGDGAIASMQRALAIWRESLGPDDPAVATALNNLGSVHYTRGELDLAATHYAESLALRERILDPGHEDIGGVLVNFARVRLGQRRLDEAHELALRAAAIFAHPRGGDPMLAARADRLVGEILLAKDDARGAVDHLERARATETRVGAAAAERAQTDFALARALWAGGAAREHTVFDPIGRERAIDLAREAAALRRQEGPGGEKALAKIDAWLKEHDVP